MAETVGAVAAAVGIPASLQSCIDLVRKAITWREQLSDSRRDYEDLCLDFPGLLFELEHLSHTCRFSVYSRTSYDRISRQVTRMAGDLKVIETKMQKKRHKVFPSVTTNKIMKVQSRLKDLLDALRNLREDAENERSRARSEGQDYFLVGRNNARRDGPDIVLNFESREENGQRRTFEGQLLDALLASNSSKTITACARGYGGVGKTCALRGVANQSEVEERFWGGVLYGTLGQDARKGQLREMIVEMVKRSGGTKMATELSAKKDFEEFVICAGQWFQPFPCLFLIDDVWLSDGSDVRDFGLVRNLARHPLSRVAFTTRNTALRADTKILFEHRERGGEDSRGILLKTAGFEAEPKQPNAAEAFEELLQIGNGLPLKLALIGGGVREVADLYSTSNPEDAWVIYCKAGGDELENEKDVLMRSLSFLDKDSPNGVHHRHFKSLSVLRYAQSVKIGVVSRIWCLSEAESRVEAELLGRYHIVRLVASFTGDSKDGEITVSLHDEMLKIAREEAGRNGHLSRSARRVIYSYLSDARGETTAAVSISGSLEHAASDTRLGLDARGMVCAVGESIEEANLDVGSSESMGDVAFHAEHWPTVEGDGYFYENFCWLLSGGKLYDLMKWLISEPQWLIRQLSALGVGQVQSDLDVVAESFTGDSDSPDVNDLKRCIELTKSTTLASKVDLILSKWDGMPWFQLYGRLSHFVEQSDWIRMYVGKIERLAPRPWYKPSVGCLLPASMSLQETISVRGCPRCVALVENVVGCCYQKSGEVILQNHNLSSSADCDRVVLYKSADYLCDAALSEDARTVVLCLESGDILLRHLDLEIQSRVMQIEPSESVPSKSFANYVRTVVKGGEKFIKKWKSRDQKNEAQNCHKTVGNHEDVNCVARSQNGEIIVSGSWDGTVRVWKTRDREWESTVLEGNENCVLCVAVSVDGTQIVSGSYDCTVRVWKMRNAKWESTALEGHKYWVNCVSMSADGTHIVSGSADETVRIWKMRNAEWESIELKVHTGPVNCVSVSADGTLFVSGSNECSVQVWKKRDGEWKSTALEGHTHLVKSVSMSVNGTQIVSGSDDGTVRVWSTKNREWERTVLEGHKASVRCVSVSTDRTQIVSGSDDSLVQVWKVQDGEWKSTILEGHTDVVNCVSVSADGTQIMSGSGDKTLRVWNIKDGEWQSTVLEGHEALVLCVAVSGDGTQIVSGSFDETVRLWKLRDGEWDSTILEGHTDLVRCVSVSEDGSLIVSGSDDCTVRVWNQRDGQWESTVLKGHTAWVHSVSVSANGTQIVTGSYDETMRIWRRQGGEWDSTALEGYTEKVESVTMSEDGSQIVLKSGRNTVEWNFVNEKWERTTESSVPRGCVTLNTDIFAIGGITALSELNFPLNEVARAIGAEEAYPIYNSYFFTVPRYPYFVRIEKVI